LSFHQITIGDFSPFPCEKILREKAKNRLQKRLPLQSKERSAKQAEKSLCLPGLNQKNAGWERVNLCKNRPKTRLFFQLP